MLIATGYIYSSQTNTRNNDYPYNWVTSSLSSSNLQPGKYTIVAKCPNCPSWSTEYAANKISTLDSTVDYGVMCYDSSCLSTISSSKDFGVVVYTSPIVQQCEILSAGWSTNQTTDNQTVQMSATTNGYCTGKNIRFELLEDDSPFGTDFEATIYPAVSGNKLTGSWKAKWQYDQIGDPEYFFKVFVDNVEKINTPLIYVVPYKITLPKELYYYLETNPIPSQSCPDYGTLTKECIEVKEAQAVNKGLEFGESVGEAVGIFWGGTVAGCVLGGLASFSCVIPPIAAACPASIDVTVLSCSLMTADLEFTLGKNVDKIRNNAIVDSVSRYITRMSTKAKNIIKWEKPQSARVVMNVDGGIKVTEVYYTSGGNIRATGFNIPKIGNTKFYVGDFKRELGDEIKDVLIITEEDAVFAELIFNSGNAWQKAQNTIVAMQVSPAYVSRINLFKSSTNPVLGRYGTGYKEIDLFLAKPANFVTNEWKIVMKDHVLEHEVTHASVFQHIEVPNGRYMETFFADVLTDVSYFKYTNDAEYKNAILMYLNRFNFESRVNTLYKIDSNIWAGTEGENELAMYIATARKFGDSTVEQRIFSSIRERLYSRNFADFVINKIDIKAKEFLQDAEIIAVEMFSPTKSSTYIQAMERRSGEFINSGIWVSAFYNVFDHTYNKMPLCIINNEYKYTEAECTVQVDADNDGYSTNDCNDNDSSVNPGAADAVCNGIDNNCNGIIDDQYVKHTCSTGACSGQTSCTSGSEICSGPAPSQEVCDNVDNDCDSYTDEFLVRQCGTTDIGACQYGNQACMSGIWGACGGNIEPIAETCNSVDDNCNGQTDENVCTVQRYLWNADSNSDKIYKINTQGTVMKSFAAPSGNTIGIAFDGTNLWVSDSGTDKIYKVNVNGVVLSSFNAPNTNLRDISYDGTYLWTVDSSAKKIYKISTTGTILSIITAPDITSRGIEYDNGYLWITGDYSNKIYKTTLTGTVVKSFASPSTMPTGIAVEGDYLWIADAGADKIYKITKSGLVLSSFKSPYTYPTGLAIE